MLEVLKNGNTLKNPAKGSWVRVTEPTNKDIARIRKLVEFPGDIKASFTDPDEIPTLEKFPNFTYLLIRVPIKKTGEDELQFKTAPLAILTSKDYFITISAKSQILDKFTPKTVKGMAPILNLLFLTSRQYLKFLKETGKELYSTQEDLERSTENKEIIQLLELDKSLVYFNTALRANQYIIERLAREKLTRQDKELVYDIINENKQAMSTTKIYSAVISEMTTAFSSIISNNLNKRIEALTVITIILMLPTLIASVYGMNITLPIQHDPNAFWVLMGISVLLSMIGGAIFWWRKVS